MQIFIIGKQPTGPASQPVDVKSGKEAGKAGNFMEDEQWLSTISQYSRKIKHWNRFRDLLVFEMLLLLPPVEATRVNVGRDFAASVWAAQIRFTVETEKKGDPAGFPTQAW
ncbi:hypothetical protein INR49_005627, partial [Caranx melampygus]